MASNTKRELYSERYTFAMRPSFLEKMKKFGERADKDKSEILRDGADFYMNGYLPVLGVIPCGPLKEAVEATPYYKLAPPAMLPRADLGDFLLEAEGDSMSPRIERGDLVLLRPGIMAGDGEVCAVQVYDNPERDGECTSTLKRLFRDHANQQVILRPYNPDYEEIIVPKDHIKIIGVLRGLLGGVQ